MFSDSYISKLKEDVRITFFPKCTGAITQLNNENPHCCRIFYGRVLKSSWKTTKKESTGRLQTPEKMSNLSQTLSKFPGKPQIFFTEWEVDNR